MRLVTLVGLAVIGASALGADTADIEMYTDYQIGLWNVSGSAAMVLNDTQNVRSFNRSMRVTMSPNSYFQWKHGWEGQDIAGVSALEFWVYAPQGGVNTMTVQARVLGNPRTLVNVSNYVTTFSGWTKVSIPFSAFGVAANERLQLIWFRAPVTAGIPTFWMEDVKLVKPTHGGVSQVTVNTAAVIRQITKKDFGVGTSTWDWTMDLDDTTQKLRDGGITFANFPGGYMSDQYDWRLNRSTRTGETCWVSSLRFLDMIDTIDGEAMLTVNYGSGTVQDARDWVHYANVEHDRNVLNWTIGNECYHPDQYDTRPAPYARDADTYAQFWIQAYHAMRAVDPRIKIGFVGALSETDWPQRTTVINPRTGTPVNGWGAVVLTRFREAGITPDYMDFHMYSVAPYKESDAQTLQMADRVKYQLTLVRQLLNDYLGANAANVKLHLTEANSVWMPVSRQSVSMTNALYLADFWGHSMAAGLETFVWWNLHNGANQDGNFHPSIYGSANYGDYGILSRGMPSYSPALNTPYPTYYAFKQLKNFIRPGDWLAPVASNNPHISVWAAVTQTGDVRLMLINKAKASDFWVKVNVPGYVLPRIVTTYRYGLPEEQTWGGVVTQLESFGSSLLAAQVNSVRVNRYSIVVVDL